MNVVISEAAWSDMLQIARAIMIDNPVRADSFLTELYERCESLGQMPRAFPLLPGHEEQGIRRRVHGNYLIFYRIGDKAIDVLHVLHGARDYERLIFGSE